MRLFAKLFCKSFYLRYGFFVKGRLNGNGVFRPVNVLAALQHLLHDLRSHGSPGAVFHESDGLVLVAALGEVVYELSHEGENLGVIGGGGKNDGAVTECVLNCLGHIIAGKVGNRDLGAALFLQLLCQQLNSFFGMAVNGGVGDSYALALNAVGGPDVVGVKIVAQVLGQNGTVERADDLNVKGGCLLEQSLHHGTVLADDAEVVAACLACPALGVFNVVCAELAEAVSGEEHLVGAVIGNDDLGSVHHGGGYKGESVGTQTESVAIADNDAALCEILTEEILHHGECLGRGYDGCIGVFYHEVYYVCGVVGLHVLNHEVIGLSTIELGFEIAQPFIGETLIDCVHDGDFLVYDDIGVVCHAQRHDVLSLKQVNLVVVYAYVATFIVSPFMLRQECADCVFHRRRCSH